MSNDSSLFDQIEQSVRSQGVDPALEALAGRLRDEKRLHELFDVRLMQARHRAGLPIILTTPLDELPEALRDRMEDAYLGACREVGHGLLADGRIRDAWMYLRPVGDKAAVAEALAQLPAAEHYESIIEIALHEGVSPTLGFRTAIDQLGLCNAITMYDTEMSQRPREQRQAVAEMLVREIHRDLLGSVGRNIEQEQGSPPVEQTVADLVRERDWLFAENNYHVDTTHLNAIVRFALIVDDPHVLRLALDLAEYGRRLAPTFHYDGEEPFDDPYPASALFFQALLGENTDEALEYFRGKAETLDIAEVGTGPAEVYVSLLARLGRHAEAVEAAAKLLPRGTPQSGFAPSLLELAAIGGQHERLRQVCRERDDIVGFVASLVDEKRKAESGKPS